MFLRRMGISGKPGEWGKSCFPGNRCFSDKQAAAEERLRGWRERKTGIYGGNGYVDMPKVRERI